VRFLLSRATRLISSERSQATALRRVNASMARIADLDCRRNYGFGAALAVVFRKPVTAAAPAAQPMQQIG
jgi:hypothetical protein